MNTVITSIVTFIATMVISQLSFTIKGRLHKLNEQIDNNNRGTLQVLWWCMQSDYNRIIRKGYATNDEKVLFGEMYDAYHAMGGNGLGTKMYDRIVQMPLKEEVEL